MMYKKGITVKDWIIMSVVFGVVFALFVTSIAGFSQQATEDGVNGTNLLNPKLAKDFDTWTQNTQTINNVTQSMGKPGGMSVISGFQAFLGGTVAVFGIAYDTIGIIPALMTSFVSDFGIPYPISSIIVTFVGGIIGIIVVFAILNAAKGTGRV